MVDLTRISMESLQSELSRRQNCETQPKKNIILLGPPGSGKGTQSNKLIHDFCYCQLSTGDLLRDNVKRKTPAGIKAKQAMDAGQLVSDQIVNEILIDAINSPSCSRGIIFDGYPRTTDQAENLNNLLTSQGKRLNNVIELKVDEELLFERVEGRRIHVSSGRSYHVKFNPPKEEGKDDVSGEPLIHRSDDTRETLKSRLDVYNEKTAPISGFYAKQGLLTSINAMQDINRIYSGVKGCLI